MQDERSTPQEDEARHDMEARSDEPNKAVDEDDEVEAHQHRHGPIEQHRHDPIEQHRH